MLPNRANFLLAGAGLSIIIFPLLALAGRAIETRAWGNTAGDEILQAMGLSFLTTSISLLFILLLGTPLAFRLAKGRWKGRWLLNSVLEMPIVLPPAVAGLALLVAFGRRGWLGNVFDDVGIQLAFSTSAVIIAQIFIALPFYTRAAQVGFGSINPELEEAARVDGANGWQVFSRITLPLARRALLSGALLSWARALGEFGATIIFAGSLAGKTRTMPLLVYHILERDLNAAIWTALLLIGVAAGVVALTTWLAKEQTD